MNNVERGERERVGIELSVRQTRAVPVSVRRYSSSATCLETVGHTVYHSVSQNSYLHKEA